MTIVFLHMLVACVDHDKSEEINTLRYIKVMTLSMSEQLTLRLVTGMGGCHFLDIIIYLHLDGLSDK